MRVGCNPALGFSAEKSFPGKLLCYIGIPTWCGNFILFTFILFYFT